MIKLLKKQIEESKNIVLFGHRNPDGDAMGATLAMCGVLKGLGKNVNVVLPNAYPGYLAWLNGADDILVFDGNKDEVLDVLSKTDFIIALDFNAFSRLGELEEHIPSVPCAMIDHHPFPSIETDMLFSDTSVSSTCEYLTAILYDMELSEYITEAEATSLFVGILTDTGRFNHNSSHPQTYRMVANLMEKGVDKDAVIDRLFSNSTEQRMRLTGFLLSEKMEIFREQGLALITLSSEEKQRFSYQKGDAEGLVNMPLSIEGITCSVFMQEHEDLIRMSFRSKGDRVINNIASENFGGGGHANAAGGASAESLEDTLAKVKTIFEV